MSTVGETQRAAVRHVCIASGVVTNAVGTAIYLRAGQGAVRLFEATGFCGEELAELQTVLGEGPAFEATQRNRPVLVPDLVDSVSTVRWPLFASAAVEAGVEAVFAFPLTQGAMSVGALEVHRDTGSALTPDEIAAVVQLAEMAMALLPRPTTTNDEVEQVSDQRVAQTFVELADTLVERFDSIEFLHVLAERCVELLAVDAAAILLADDQGALKLVATSSELVRPMEHLLLQSEDSPAAECFRSGQPVLCPELHAEPQRWPRFSAAATKLGFGAFDALPMRLREDVIGSLNLFRTSPGPLPEGSGALAQSFANVATISLLQVRSARHNQMLAEQLQVALASRVEIEQAKGVLTERLQIGVEDAFSLMRNYARNSGQLLSDVAQQVNARSPEVTALTRVSRPRSSW
ncbi:GAF and ANTAR domain-containing protein [Lentzea sp. BCCO 10_0856]|uniref:GAF and ANTAR domain-containing protein n=1 Tax=Lentzea miocenica TaxID=3095431 RepID=A0ABU4T7J3_9PSEU|nr:GAF and ANTAR domain-containing protein [Lentzea sp. BCCO 10_0856]MDX8034044.1 GAF and ANTAR domain-containing protein [Lentzea sp. BCCO 10_0856]